MGRPLNADLHARLKVVFGEVKTANEGLPFRGSLIRDPLHPERMKIAPGSERGEEYQVCCPRCKDKRFRLWFNHRHGTRMGGTILRGMYVCWNEQCQEERDFRDWVDSHLKPYFNRQLSMREAAVQQEEYTEGGGEMKPVLLPRSTPLHMLPPDHPARAYLESREYDTEYLGQTFDVRWAEENPHSPRYNRILFPIYAEDPWHLIKCYGYQARFFDPVSYNDKPDKAAGEIKWHTWSAKVKRLLYNSIRAKNSPVVMIGEGPLDVPRMGDRFGLGTFGKTMSSTQRDLLWRGWGQHGAILVLAYDPDAYNLQSPKTRKGAEKLIRMEKEMRSSWKGVVRLPIPDGMDPGKLGYTRLWELALQELYQAGNRDNYMQVATAVGAQLE